MVRLNIKLDEARKAFIDKQIALGRFADADAFFDEAVALVQQRMVDEEIAEPLSEEEERQVMESIDDPTPATAWTRESLANMKRELIKEHAKRPGN